MRLTLRTLLAYLDDILKPNEVDELGAKIRESDFASGLIHRIRNSINRAALSSPPIMGKGLGADANTVAEYLDNALPSERMPEFEKVCLESDIMLAEVASCHQILANDLGEHASVEPSLRRRVYALASHAGTDASVSSADAGFQQASPHDQTYHRVDEAISHRDLLSVPQRGSESMDVLRAPSARSWWRVLAAIIVLGALGAVAWQWKPWQTGRELPLAQSTLHESVNAAPDRLESNAAQDSRTEDDPRTYSAAPPESLVIPPPSTTRAVDEESIYNSPVALPPSPPANSAIAPATENADPSGDRLAMAPNLDAPNTDGKLSSEGTPPSLDDDLMTNDVPPPPAHGTGSEGQDEPQGTPVQLLADRSVIAAWRGDEQAWRRLPSMKECPFDVRLNVLPAFAPRMIFVDCVDVTAQGPAEWIQRTADDRWHVISGRFVISNLQEQPVPLRMVIGKHQVDLRCVQPSSIVLLQVQQLAPLGVDPAQSARYLAVHMWIVHGAVRIAWDDKDELQVDAGHRWSFLADRAPQVVVDVPQGLLSAWSIRDIDRQAREAIAALLAEDVPLAVGLQSAWQDRRTDVRSLAARGLATTGIYGPLIETLSDPRFHASWTQHYEILREAVQQSPESAENVRRALQLTAGQAADVLERMLWGFSSAQLASSAAEDLVEALGHRELSVRVLAGESLKAITGASAGFRADYHLKRRQDAVRIWQRRLNEGTIRYAKIPENDVASLE